MKQAMSAGAQRARHRSEMSTRGHGVRDGVALALLGGLLFTGWLCCRDVYQRRQLERPVAKPSALQRWEGEGGQPLPDPPPDPPPQ